MATAQATLITAGRIRALLASLPADTPVLLAHDPEGNGYGVAFEMTLESAADVTEACEFSVSSRTGKVAVLWPDR
jgi:hypothetical protein